MKALMNEAIQHRSEGKFSKKLTAEKSTNKNKNRLVFFVEK